MTGVMPPGLAALVGEGAAKVYRLLAHRAGARSWYYPQGGAVEIADAVQMSEHHTRKVLRELVAAGVVLAAPIPRTGTRGGAITAYALPWSWRRIDPDARIRIAEAVPPPLLRALDSAGLVRKQEAAPPERRVIAGLPVAQS